MLFGAAVGRILIDTMPTGERPDIAVIHVSIDQVAGALFTGAE
ncbi:MAG TPA: hypothetical protein VLZ76_07740 [Lysobacter sp.]|nr:hypothetical protein [Lysobacter sp.]